MTTAFEVTSGRLDEVKGRLDSGQEYTVSAKRMLTGGDWLIVSEGVL